MDNKFNIKKIIIKIIISFLVIGLIVLGLYFLFKYLGWINLTKEELQAKIASTGVFAPLVFIFASFLQVTFIPIPSSITIIVGNYLFGFWLSFLYSYIGIVLGSILAFYLGRWLGRPFVNWVVGDNKVVDEYLIKMKNKENVILFFMFLLPLFPDDALCSLAGILPISLMTFLIMQLFTRAISILGTLFFMSGEIIHYDAIGISIMTLVCVIALVAFYFSYKYADKINDTFYKVIDKIFFKRKK